MRESLFRIRAKLHEKLSSLPGFLGRWNQEKLYSLRRKRIIGD